MKIVGVTLVRNVADIIAVTVRYHLGLGLDEVRILDNDSTDGTPDVLQQLAADDDRVRWRSAPGEYQQAELVTALAQEASRDGADWIVPFDADEFWYAPCESFRSVLERTTAGALRAQVVNYIQTRDQSRREASALVDDDAARSANYWPAGRHPRADRVSADCVRRGNVSAEDDRAGGTGC